MKLASGRSVLGGAVWTIGTYAASVTVRFGSNIVLSRLVAPEIFGTILIVMTIRNGADLISDVGIGQNVVNNKDGDKPEFLNTAWTIQVVRGLALFAIFMILARPLAEIYRVPEAAIQVGALTLALLGLASTSIFTMQRRLQLARLNLFDLAQDVVSATAVLAFAALSPTIWAILAANVLSVALRTVASFLLPDARNRPVLSRRYATQILSFGKWIFLWSTLGFLCTSFDRLYLGTAAPLALLGVYGIARTMADLPVALAGRLGHSLIFPLISSAGDLSREGLRSQVASHRLKFLLAAALGLSCAISVADVVIRILYDARYGEAAWMLPLMLLGAWGSILCTINEYSLLGLGKPLYGAVANSLKLGCMVVGLPLAFETFGIVGAIAVVGASEVFRYAPLLVGQVRERLTFCMQDLLATAVLMGSLLLLTLLRRSLSLGTAFDGVPFP